MPTTIEGCRVAGETPVAIAVARFNELVTRRLLEGACEAWGRHGGDPEALTVGWVPGSFELPLLARRFAESGRYAAVVCLGCIVEGETDHYDHVVSASVSGIAAAGRESGVPVMFGVVTAGTMEQALDRAGGKHGNQGERAMVGAIEMADLLRKI